MAEYQQIFQRNMMLWGNKAQAKLQASHLVIVGLGGVGGYIAEGLARAGIGQLTLIDYDKVAPSNINRQLVALNNNIGQSKIALMADRIRQINPDCRLNLQEAFIDSKNAAELLPKADYYIDAIDSVEGKVAIVETAFKRGIKVASALGAAKRLAPESLRITDISKTQNCPLAKIMRRKLRAIGIEKGLMVVYSEELPLSPAADYLASGNNAGLAADEKNNLSCDEMGKALASAIFVPASAGLLLSSAIVRRIISEV